MGVVGGGVFLIYLVCEDIAFCAGAVFMDQGIVDDQMTPFSVRD